MAFDESLLESALAADACFVRCYRWAEATISLGYFQDAAAAADVPELCQLPLVRRLSGGGAILHHHELTYSCVVPASHPLAAAPQRLYLLVHDRIVSVLARFGVTADLRSGHSRPAGQISGLRTQRDRECHGRHRSAASTPSESDAGPSVRAEEGSRFGPDTASSFLCFARSDPRDIVLGGHKVVGSAQRRRKGAVLQHGSLLLARSQHAPQFPGIGDLSSTALPDGRLAELLAGGLGRLLGDDCRFVTFDADLSRRAGKLERERYGRTDWTTATGRARTARIASTP